MNTFLKKWNGRTIEVDSPFMSKEAKSFVTAFKNMLKRELGPDYDVDIHRGHYYLSGFIKHDGMYVYIAYDIPRYDFRVDADSTGTAGCLFRCARGPEDYTGGINNFCSIRELPESVTGLFESQRKRGFH